MANIIGQTLLGQYRVDEFIASGGMGAVYKVWDLKRSVPLAMKVLHADFVDDPSSFKYFQREARALEKLRHPNVVPFYGLFQEGQTAFILEHYVDGSSLREILNNHKAGLPIPEVLTYMQALCSALGYAHSSGVVHCDIKPGNVMVDHGGQVYLADFGIARHAESSSTTIAGSGTPAYMAPEQIRAQPVVPATDIYSLGVLLFELLTGQKPFRGDEPASTGKGDTSGERIRYAHLHLVPPDPRSVNPAISPALAQIVLKCMAKMPENRYAYTGELLTALTNLGVNAAPRVQVPEIPPVSKPPRPVQPIVSAPQNPQKNLLPVLLTIIAVFGIIMVVLVMLLFSGTSVSPPPTQPESISTQSSVVQLLPSNVPSYIEPTYTTMPQDTVAPPVIISSDTRLPTLTTTLKIGSTSTSSSDGMVMVYIPAGEFIMGASASDSDAMEDEFPQHAVYLDAFWIDKFEVTNSMFTIFVQSTNYRTQAEVDDWTWEFDGQDWSKPKGTNWRHPLRANKGLNGLDNHPVVRISQADAQAYCKWAGRRLLTEAEWEKAARGDNGSLYPWGNQFSCSYANLGNSGCDSYSHTAPVGKFPDGASPYGILDMSGNVWEWVSDWYQKNYYENSPYQNPRGPNNGDGFIMRGGSWSSKAEWLRLSYRSWGYADNSYWSTGFRCGSDVSMP